MMGSTDGGMSKQHPYRDASLSIDARVDDLLQRMTLTEKVGQMFHSMIARGLNGALAGKDPNFGFESTEHYVEDQHLTHFNMIGGIESVQEMVAWYNKLQELALSTRLGIPVTLSTDPRHHFTVNVGTAARSLVFSQWPETLGFAALRDPALVEKFADIARQEYVAVGLRCALHPQIDLSTEPRWARINATFGEDAALTNVLTAAYIRGFQGERIGSDSVSCMAKHFPGGGATKNGEDPHFEYGQWQVYPGGQFDLHLQPFREAIAAGVRQMMPSYGRPEGTKYEEVAWAFNHQIITALLRNEMGFHGIVCTDWGLVTDATIMGQNMPARAWGCKSLTEVERLQRLIEAGCDQIGGETCTQLLLQAVTEGRVTEKRLDQSLRLLLKEKFMLGLFDQPFVDLEKALQAVGTEENKKLGHETQCRSYTLLTNSQSILPVDSGKYKKIYIEGLGQASATARGFEVVSDPSQADLALLRLQAPYELHPGAFSGFFHTGSLEYPSAEIERQAAIFRAVPTVVDLYLDRPAVVPRLVQEAAAVIVNYGSTDEAFLDVALGKIPPEGKLPFDMPSSMQAVVENKEDTPFDTKDPLFTYGHGLSYA